MSNIEIFTGVLELEAQSLLQSKERIDARQVQKLEKIFDVLKNLGGNLVFCGVGKSGLIGEKLASTFTSLGLRSFHLHPVEALHGDLGRVGPNDAIVFLSKSGTTEEIMKLIPFLPIEKSMRIGLLGNIQSKIGNESDLVFDCSVEKEACINNLAPTTSSTVALAMGDAMAVLYEKISGLSKEGFAVNHPGGLLGKSLSLKVGGLLWKKNDCPCLGPDALLKDALIEMTAKPIGACAILEGEKFLGIIVEGDIRRTFTRENSQGLETRVTDIMTKGPISTSSDALAFEALKLMEDREKALNILPVIDGERFVGLIRLHDLLKEGFHSSKA